jgi:hypothetical protein
MSLIPNFLALLLQTCTTYLLFHAFLCNAENAASQVFSQQKFLVMHYGNIMHKFRTSFAIMFHYFFWCKIHIILSHGFISFKGICYKCCFMKLSRSAYRSTICTLLVWPHNPTTHVKPLNLLFNEDNITCQTQVAASEICWKRAKTSLPIPHLRAQPES